MVGCRKTLIVSRWLLIYLGSLAVSDFPFLDDAQLSQRRVWFLRVSNVVDHIVDLIGELAFELAWLTLSGFLHSNYNMKNKEKGVIGIRVNF